MGLTGRENDNEVKGEGNQQDYGMRVYDSGLGRFLSLDPIADEFPWQSPYVFAANNPIALIDVDGMAAVNPDKQNFFASIGTPLVKALQAKGINTKNAMYILGQVIIE